MSGYADAQVQLQRPTANHAPSGVVVTTLDPGVWRLAMRYYRPITWVTGTTSATITIGDAIVGDEAEIMGPVWITHLGTGVLTELSFDLFVGTTNLGTSQNFAAQQWVRPMYTGENGGSPVIGLSFYWRDDDDINMAFPPDITERRDRILTNMLPIHADGDLGPYAAWQNVDIDPGTTWPPKVKVYAYSDQTATRPGLNAGWSVPILDGTSGRVLVAEFEILPGVPVAFEGRDGGGDTTAIYNLLAQWYENWTLQRSELNGHLNNIRGTLNEISSMLDDELSGAIGTPTMTNPEFADDAVSRHTDSAKARLSDTPFGMPSWNANDEPKGLLSPGGTVTFTTPNFGALSGQTWTLSADHTAFDTVRTPLHAFMVSMTTLWGLGRVWSEFRRV